MKGVRTPVARLLVLARPMTCPKCGGPTLAAEAHRHDGIDEDGWGFCRACSSFVRLDAEPAAPVGDYIDVASTVRSTGPPEGPVRGSLPGS